MGAEAHTIKKKIKKITDKLKKDEPKEKIFCPFCNSEFDGNEPKIFNSHIRCCGISRIRIKKACDLFPPSQDIQLNALIFENQKK